MIEIKKYEAEYEYYGEYDILNIAIKQDYVHKETVEMEFGIYLDFSQNNVPVNLEMLWISKYIGVDKKYFSNLKGNVTVIVGEVINVVVTFEFENDTKILLFKALNDFSIPICETNLALV